ncbi:MAG: methenyltetrahydromethanopterin cyclohydrolase, partial [Hyphomicrobiales bacterium]
MSANISVNARAAALVERLIADAAELKVGVTRGASGETLIDCGAKSRGSIAAGLRIAEICMGGLGAITLELSAVAPNWPATLVSRSSNPVIACLA